MAGMVMKMSVTAIAAYANNVTTVITSAVMMNMKRGKMRS